MLNATMRSASGYGNGARALTEQIGRHCGPQGHEAVRYYFLDFLSAASNSPSSSFVAPFIFLATYFIALMTASLLFAFLIKSTDHVHGFDVQGIGSLAEERFNGFD